MMGRWHGCWLILAAIVAPLVIVAPGLSQERPAAIKIGATLAVTGPFSAE